MIDEAQLKEIENNILRKLQEEKRRQEDIKAYSLLKSFEKAEEDAKAFGIALLWVFTVVIIIMSLGLAVESRDEHSVKPTVEYFECKEINCYTVRYGEDK